MERERDEDNSQISDGIGSRNFSICIRHGRRLRGTGWADRTPGHYCMVWTLGGSDCSFTSYAQCLATASANAAECYGKTVGDDEGSGIQGRFGYASRAQIR